MTTQRLAAGPFGSFYVSETSNPQRVAPGAYISETGAAITTAAGSATGLAVVNGVGSGGAVSTAAGSADGLAIVNGVGAGGAASTGAGSIATGIGIGISIGFGSFIRGAAAPSALTYMPTVGTAPTFVGGTYKGIAAYAGPALRIDNGSGTQTDIAFASNGYIDAAAVLAFTGGSVIDGVKITTVYDQTGNGNNATQSTLANMPVLATDPEGFPIISWSISGSYLQLASIALTSTTCSIFHLGRFVSGAIWQFGAGTAFQGVTTASNKLCYGTSTSRQSSFVPYENTSVIGMVSGASLVFSIDSTLATTASPAGTSSTTGGRWGNSTTANTSMTGDTQLLAIYPATLGTTDAANVRTAMTAMRSIPAKTKILALSEDSLTAGTGSTFNRNRTYWLLTDATIRANVKVFNKAKGGRTLATANSDFAAEGVPVYDATATANVWGILGGVNDIIQGADAATTETRFGTYADTIAATGFTKVAYSLPVTSADPTMSAAVNTWLDANYSTYAGALVNFRLSSIGTGQSGNNSYYFDSTNPNSLGYQVWSAYELATIKTALGL